MKIVVDEQDVDRGRAIQERAWLFAMNGRGYVVLGSESQLHPGQEFTSHAFSRACAQKMYVIRETDLDDMDEQSRLFDLVGYFDTWHRWHKH